jgi:hypothetical protein
VSAQSEKGDCSWEDESPRPEPVTYQSGRLATERSALEWRDLIFGVAGSWVAVGQRCQPSRPTAGDSGPSQFLPGWTGRRKNRPSRRSMSMTARRPGTDQGRHKPRPRQSSTVPGQHQAVRVYTWIKPNEALTACGKIYKFCDAFYLCIKPLCKSESKDK